jgi:predicted alpha/beta hydrolase family esterase
VRIIIVPGWRDSCPGHWQSLWAERLRGSSNDPFCPVRLAGAYARAWGSEFVRMQDAGHINIDSGHGEWPLGMALLQSLAGNASLTSSPCFSSFPPSTLSSFPFGSLETA